MRVCVCACVHVCVRTCVCVCACMFACVCLCVCMQYVCTRVCQQMFVNITLLICECVNGWITSYYLVSFVYVFADGLCDDSDFQCKRSRRCVHPSRMCNKVFNCGKVENQLDDSDEKEEYCEPFRRNVFNERLFIASASGFVLMVIIVALCAFCCRRKHQQKQVKQKIEVRYVTRGSTPNRTTVANGQKMHLVERTEMISIV